MAFAPIIKIKGKRGVWHDGINHASKEEVYLRWYLDELFEAGLIEAYDYQPPAFKLSDKVVHTFQKQLKTKVKTVSKTLLQPHQYRPDFKITWADIACPTFFAPQNCKIDGYPFVARYGVSFVDVKGSYSKFGDSDTKAFRINQKWVYAKYQAYVQPVVPQKLFKTTFCPKRYRYTDVSFKPRKGTGAMLDLNTFLDMQDFPF